GTGVSSSFSLATSSGTKSTTFSNLAPGSGYAVSETVPSGWSQTSAICDNGNDPSAITLPAGGTVTCTFTNSKNPKLKVIKTVVNNSGGTATASSFTMHVSGTAVSSTQTFAGSSTGTQVTVTAGSYTVSEDSVTGYTQTSASADCSGTLAAGDDKTCTITNTDVAPQLTVIKHVVNNSGGTATASP